MAVPCLRINQDPAAAFEYTALDLRGKQKKGVLEADSMRQIRQILRDQGLVPLQVDTASERRNKATSRSTSSSLFKFTRSLGALDRVLFTRQLATLTGAGLPIEEALQAIAQRFTHEADAAIILSSETVFAALAGFLFLSERLTTLELTGASLIFIGIITVQLLPMLRNKARQLAPGDRN